MESNNYILITAAKNEEDYIEKPLAAVASQSIKPKKWLIVNDGSVDRTAEIANRFAKNNRFIELVENPSESHRNFGSKAQAFNFAYRCMQNRKFDFIGNLDADVAFDSAYYESVLSKFKANQNLGVAGGIRYDWHDGKFKRVTTARNSVGGSIQFFRRECLERIGGYLPLEYGGIDAVAETMARKNGWAVESFPDINVYHYRATGTAVNNPIGVYLKAGIRDYLIGYHPLFLILRAVSRIHQKPYILGSLIWIYGYFQAHFKHYKRPVTTEFVRYLRAEQLMRLRSPEVMAKHNILRR